MPSESYNVSLKSAYDKPRSKRAEYSIASLYDFLQKHTRKERKDIILSNEVNEYIWQRSITKPPRRISISIKEDKENNKVYVFLKDSNEFKNFKLKSKEQKKEKDEKPKDSEKQASEKQTVESKDKEKKESLKNNKKENSDSKIIN